MDCSLNKTCYNLFDTIFKKRKKLKSILLCLNFQLMYVYLFTILQQKYIVVQWHATNFDIFGFSHELAGFGKHYFPESQAGSI